MRASASNRAARSLGPRRSWALGMQLGPRFGAAPGSRGIGFEGLALVARQQGRWHLVLSSGVLVDVPLGGAYRPLALEAGVDLAVDVDRNGVWSLVADAAAVYFVSIDPHQIALSAGASWSPRPWLSVSVTALCGFLDGTLEARGIPWSKTVIGGFSQGAAMSCAVAVGADWPRAAGSSYTRRP